MPGIARAREGKGENERKQERDIESELKFTLLATEWPQYWIVQNSKHVKEMDKMTHYSFTLCTHSQKMQSPAVADSNSIFWEKNFLFSKNRKFWENRMTTCVHVISVVNPCPTNHSPFKTTYIHWVWKGHLPTCPSYSLTKRFRLEHLNNKKNNHSIFYVQRVYQLTKERKKNQFEKL